MLVVLIGSLWGAGAFAQTLSDIRDDLSESLRQAKFASSLGALVLLSEELELSGGRLDIDSEGGTEVSTLVLPFATSLSPFGSAEFGLYVEGVVGHSTARDSIDDLYAGELPGLETAISSRWTSDSALAGVGPEWHPTESLRVAGILSFGVARLENEADYQGPGAAATASLLDGVAFNWEAWTLNYGASARVDWIHELGPRRSIALIGRYDARWTDVIDSDDPAQEFTTRLQLATVRAEYRSPTGWSAGAFPVDYRLRAGSRRLVEGDIFGAQQVFELGGTLEFLTGERLPLASGVTVSGAAFFSDDVTGWTAGVGLAF